MEWLLAWAAEQLCASPKALRDRAADQLDLSAWECSPPFQKPGPRWSRLDRVVRRLDLEAVAEENFAGPV